MAQRARSLSVGPRPPRDSAGRLMQSVRRLSLALLALALPASAQDARAPVPFGLGERADYSVKYGPFSVGSGIMEVVSLDTVRGRETWHTIFRVRGGVPGFRVNDRMESWMDTGTLASLRHRQELDE